MYVQYVCGLAWPVEVTDIRIVLSQQEKRWFTCQVVEGDEGRYRVRINSPFCKKDNVKRAGLYCWDVQHTVKGPSVQSELWHVFVLSGLTSRHPLVPMVLLTGFYSPPWVGRVSRDPAMWGLAERTHCTVSNKAEVTLKLNWTGLVCWLNWIHSLDLKTVNWTIFTVK